MSLVGKVFSVLALILAVFYVGITAALVSLQENFRQQMVDQAAKHKDELDGLRDELGALNRRFQELQGRHGIVLKERGELVAKNRTLQDEWAQAMEVNRFQDSIIKDQEKKIARLNQQVENYRAENLDGRRVIDNLNGKIAQLERDKEELAKARDQFADRLTKTEVALDGALREGEKVTEDNARYVALLTTLKDQRPDIYAELIQGERLVPRKAIRGKVTAVDKGLGLVVMNIGQRHEVRQGYSFIVFRGPKYVGKVLVDEVFPDVAAAHYIRDSMAEDVEVGDDVTTKLVVDF